MSVMTTDDSVFGEIKCIRMPGKLGRRGQHRGFAFVEFVTKDDAKVLTSLFDVYPLEFRFNLA